jgi:hypothetical protein
MRSSESKSALLNASVNQVKSSGQRTNTVRGRGEPRPMTMTL